MKKVILILSTMLLTVSVFAAKPLKLNKGDLSVLKEDAVASWTIDLSSATWEKKDNFKTWCEGEYETRANIISESFYNSFNKYSSGLKLVSASDAPYKLVFKIDNFERKQGPGMWGSCFIKVYGTICIENAAGEVVCEITVDGVKGDTDFVENDRFGKTMDWLCRDIYKMK